ncbi:hypothetical protein C8A00DRAFT_32526 [Chaetomidium leptoderma]|uniref:Uncharacterized protein n=1 Tax=Chaetomidium leptoderma TaxID=669021 RepID=A0AAN6VPW4_9PEZI|nr:hypothetical protein C8A00DRAFT_32526 [Chaetomidium leptoderma]
MDFNSGQRFKPEPVAIKREPGVFIKSEFGSSLASLPMAPISAVKKEPIESKKLASLPMAPFSAAKKDFNKDEKPILGNIPRHRGKRGGGRRSRNHRGGNSLTHRVDGYFIRAHYGHGQVEFKIQKDSPKTRDLNWDEVETEMFRKLHRARFHIEPTERPGSFLQDFCSRPTATLLRFSVRVRQIQPRSQPRPDLPATSESGGHSAIQYFVDKEATKNEKTTFGSGFSPDTKVSKTDLKSSEAPLPHVLPAVPSWQIDNGRVHEDRRIGVLASVSMTATRAAR